MQVFHVSPPSSVEPVPVGSATTATDSADGFSQVLARQQSGQSTDAAPSQQASGTTPSAPTAGASAAASDADAGDAAVDTAAKEPADAATPATISPLADMVRDLTARSRAAAAGSLERSLAAQAAGKNEDIATSGRLDRTGRLAQDGSTTQDLALALDPAFAHLDAKGTARKSIDTAGDAPLPVGDATALVTPEVDARAAIAALRAPSGDAVTRGTNVMTGMLLPGQNASDTSTRLTQPGGLRDLKPNLSADASQGRDLGLAPRRGDATLSANALAGGKSLSGQAADPLFAGMLPGGQSGDAMTSLNPVSMMAPAVTGMAPAMAASSASILTGSIPVPVGSPQWAPAFSEQMVQIGTQQGGTLHHAELRLDPPDLGPLRVMLSMQGDQATATFVSPHASVRTAVEAALPQLMQALADAGISLGNTSVGEQDAREFAAENTRRGNGGDTGDADGADAPAQVIVQARPRGLIDTFA